MPVYMISYLVNVPATPTAPASLTSGNQIVNAGTVETALSGFAASRTGQPAATLQSVSMLSANDVIVVGGTPAR